MKKLQTDLMWALLVFGIIFIGLLGGLLVKHCEKPPERNIQTIIFMPEPSHGGASNKNCIATTPILYCAADARPFYPADDFRLHIHDPAVSVTLVMHCEPTTSTTVHIENAATKERERIFPK